MKPECLKGSEALENFKRGWKRCGPSARPEG